MHWNIFKNHVYQAIDLSNTFKSIDSTFNWKSLNELCNKYDALPSSLLDPKGSNYVKKRK